MKSNSEIGLRVAKARDLRQKNQKELSDLTNIAREQINYLENGRRTINIRQLCAIAESLNVSTDYILGYKETPYPDEMTKKVYDHTGLDVKALENLIEINRKVPYGGLLSGILASAHFANLVSMYADLLVLAEDVEGAVNIARGVYAEEGEIDPSELGDMVRELKYGQYAFVEHCKAILDDLRETTITDVLLYAESYLEERKQSGGQ